MKSTLWQTKCRGNLGFDIVGKFLPGHRARDSKRLGGWSIGLTRQGQHRGLPLRPVAGNLVQVRLIRHGGGQSLGTQQCSAEGRLVCTATDKGRNQGLPRGEGEFAEYLAQCAGNPELPRYRLTPKLGLNLLPDAAVPDRLAFVLPDQTLLPIAETVPLPTERLVSARCSRRRLSQPTPVPVRWRKAKNCWRWFGTIPSPSSCSAHRWRHPSWRWPASIRLMLPPTR